MTLATYSSVQEVLEDVRAMRPLGGSAYGHSAAMAFRLVAQEASIASVTELFTTLDQVSEELLAEKPTMATIHNAKWLIVEKTRRADDARDLENARAALIRRSDLFMRRSESAMMHLGQVGGNMIVDGQTIMMHSYSRSIISCFQAAREAGKRFEVICTESQPTRESRNAIRQLTEWGITVTFVLDAAMAVVLPEANLCLAGADSVGIDGAVANKVGTYQLALLAANFGVPLYFATEVMKLQRGTIEGFPIHLEQRPADELLDAETDFAFPERIKVRHPFFDLTPPALIRGLITEQGLIPPTGIGPAWSKLESLFGDVSDR